MCAQGELPLCGSPSDGIIADMENMRSVMRGMD
jgi:hypothetical protein